MKTSINLHSGSIPVKVEQPVINLCLRCIHREGAYEFCEQQDRKIKSVKDARGSTRLVTSQCSGYVEE